MTRIQDAFDTIAALAMPLIPDASVVLKIGVPAIERAHKQVERHFASTVTDNRRRGEFEIQVARAMGRLRDEFVWGIFLHEWGHVLAIHAEHDHEESGADLMMLNSFCIPLEHGSFLNIQHIPIVLIRELKRLAREGKTLEDLRWSPVTDERYRVRMLRVSPYR